MVVFVDLMCDRVPNKPVSGLMREKLVCDMLIYSLLVVQP